MKPACFAFSSVGWGRVVALATVFLGWLFSDRIPLAMAQSPAKGVNKSSQDSYREAAQKKANQQARAFERRTELLQFAETHEPQVKTLLAMLESKRPDQFRSALASLAREVDRLNTLEKRDPQRFEIELRDWKNNKLIQIVTAKISLRGETPELRGELRKLIVRRSDLRNQVLQLELKRTKERAEKLSQQIAQSQEQSNRDFDKQVELLIANSRRAEKNQDAKSDAKE